jgi:hypothetical protein
MELKTEIFNEDVRMVLQMNNSNMARPLYSDSYLGITYLLTSHSQIVTDTGYNRSKACSLGY